MTREAPVFLTATWRQLVMVNYAVDADVLTSLVPPGTELDFCGGRTYVSLVGFSFLNTRIRGVAIPFHRDFEEINLRFYVRREVDGEVRRGVAFVQEIVPRHAIAAAARLLYNENYVTHATRSMYELDAENAGWVEYSWHDDRRVHRVRITVNEPPADPAEGGEEQFISEHYWGYSTQRDRSVMEYRVEHPPWRIQPAADLQVEIDALACYGPRFASIFEQEPTSAFMADGSAVVVRPGREVAG